MDWREGGSSTDQVWCVHHNRFGLWKIQSQLLRTSNIWSIHEFHFNHISQVSLKAFVHFVSPKDWYPMISLCLPHLSISFHLKNRKPPGSYLQPGSSRAPVRSLRPKPQLHVVDGVSGGHRKAGWAGDWEGMGGDLRGDLRIFFFGIIGIIGRKKNWGVNQLRSGFHQ